MKIPLEEQIDSLIDRLSKYAHNYDWELGLPNHVGIHDKEIKDMREIVIEWLKEIN